MAFVQAGDLGRRLGAHNVILADIATELEVKTLNWSDVATLFPKARSLRIMCVAFQVITTGTAGNRTLFWGMHEETQQSAVVVGGQVPHNIAPSLTTFIHGDPHFAHSTHVTTATAGHPVTAWQSTTWVQFPWSQNIVIAPARAGFNNSAITFALDNADTVGGAGLEDNMFPTVFCEIH
jgi:hypothetical protein